MTIQRLDTYDDPRFSSTALLQHGAFLMDGSIPCEVEIFAATKATVRCPQAYQEQLIEEFRFYAEHITEFYDETGTCLAKFEPVQLFDVPLSQIQPSQFFVDREKKAAVATFIHSPEDIIIPMVRDHTGYISLDGHTRLSVAADLGFPVVKGFLTQGDVLLDAFVQEARHRGITSVSHMEVLSHSEYELKWYGCCDRIQRGEALP